MGYMMKFWKKKKAKETDTYEIIDELTEINNAIKESALDFAILARDTEIIVDEWYRYCEAIKKKKIGEEKC